MLRKLLKYEFRATAPVMVSLYVLLLAVSVGGNFSIRSLIDSDFRVLDVLGKLLMMAYVVAIVGACVMPLVLIVQRFRKNLMGDEGYIMFTLPVSIHQLIWAKMLTATVWTILTAVMAFFSVGIMADDIGFVAEIGRGMRTLFRELDINGAAFLAELLLYLVLACLCGCLMVYAAIAIGHSFANHKVLLSIVFFFVIQFASSFLTAEIVMEILPRNLMNWLFHAEEAQVLHWMMLTSSGVSAAYGAVYYAITAAVLHKRLNLE